MTASPAILPPDVTAPSAHERGPLRVCIVAGESRLGNGGLAAYARMLVRELRSEGVAVTTVARFDRPDAGPLDYASPSTGDGSPIDGIPTILVEPSAPWRPILRRLCHLNDRRNLRRLSPKIFTRSIESSLAAA